MQIRQPLFSEQKLPDLSTMSRLRTLAETAGFEPAVSFPTLVFKTSAFGRSATSPYAARSKASLTRNSHRLPESACS